MHRGRIAAFLLALAVISPATAAPLRVVSTYLCSDEYVFRLLPRDRIAALSFEVALRNPVQSTIVDQVKGIPTVHNSAEEVLSRHPDAVVMFQGMESRLRAQLREAGVPIIDVPWATTLDEIRKTTLLLGRALNSEIRARALLAEMDRALDAASPPSPPVRTLIYEPSGYASSDRVTDEVLAKAGLVDVAPALGPTRAGIVPVEVVVSDPPELLLLDESDPQHSSLANLVLHHPALASLSSQITIAHASLTPLSCPGPWSTSIAPRLAQIGEQARALAHRNREP